MERTRKKCDFVLFFLHNMVQLSIVAMYRGRNRSLINYDITLSKRSIVGRAESGIRAKYNSVTVICAKNRKIGELEEWCRNYFSAVR